MIGMDHEILGHAPTPWLACPWKPYYMKSKITVGENQGCEAKRGKADLYNPVYPHHRKVSLVTFKWYPPALFTFGPVAK